VIFAARVIVQRVFYVKNATGWLAATSLAMGYPLFAVGLGATVLTVRKLRQRDDSPERTALSPD